MTMKFIDLSHPKEDGSYPTFHDKDFEDDACPNCGGVIQRIATRKTMTHKGHEIYTWQDRFISCKGDCKVIFTGITNIKVMTQEIPWDDNDTTTPAKEVR